MRTEFRWQSRCDLRRDMSGTKAVWILVVALIGAAIALALLPDQNQAHVVEVPSSGDQPSTTSSFVPPQPMAEGDGVGPPPPPPGSRVSAAKPPKTPRPPVERSPDAIDDGLTEKIPQAKVFAGNVVPMKDPGTGEEYLLADGQYEIRGKGTQQEPYRVSWECLASLRNTYVPRDQEYDIPQRIALLNNKWIRVDGYLAFPVLEQVSKQLLVMFNQWDGCCIGIPPSPYDAVEVYLTAPTARKGGHASFLFGSVIGKLNVDPFVERGFVKGIYVLNEAQLNQGVQPEL